MTEITYSPFSQLVISPKNVRKVNPKKESDKQLLASIKAKGILQNLVVFVNDKGQQEVVGGGRRYAAMSILVKESVFAKDHPIPVKTVSEEEATEISLHENSGREEMHPADECEAYKAMLDEGKPTKVIGAEFGVSEAYVKRRLKLAAVAPEITQLFRDGKLNYEQVSAFTVTEDHSKQIAAYKELSPHRLSEYHIKQMLLGQAVKTDDKLVKFVTVKAYKKAGGTVTEDLFSKDSYVNEIEILNMLAEAKFKKACDSLLEQGWKWADYFMGFIPHGEYPAELEGSLENVPESLNEKVQQLEEEQTALWEKDDMEDSDYERDTEIDKELEAIQDEIESHRIFTKEQKLVSGVAVYCDSDGAIQYAYGKVKQEDRAAAFPKDESSSNADSTSSSAAQEDTKIESASLLDDLKNYQMQALQGQLLSHEDIAFDLLVFNLAETVVGGNKYGWDNPLSVSCQTSDFSKTGDIDQTKSAEIIGQSLESLNLSWCGHDSVVDRFSAFQKLTAKAKRQIMAHSVAMNLKHGFSDSSLLPNIADQMNFDLASLWRPTADNYYSRIQKKGLLNIASNELGQEWSETNSKAKKGDLVTLITTEPAMKDWMPSVIGF